MKRVCQEARFGQVSCTRWATHHASGFAAQDVDLCEFHADVLKKFDGWKVTPIGSPACVAAHGAIVEEQERGK